MGGKSQEEKGGDGEAGTRRLIPGGTDCPGQALSGPCGLLQQNTPDWVECKQQKVISYRSGGWKAEMRGPAWLGSGERWHLLALSSSGGRKGCGSSPGSSG